MGIKENQEGFLRIGRRKSVKRDRSDIVVGDLLKNLVAWAIKFKTDWCP